MKLITAIDEYFDENKISCFLGGGITNCENWQQEVIKTINNSSFDTSNLILYNPRRDNFPIDDPYASEGQINWEYKYLSNSDMFTMYFCNTEKSDQPICFYELGRYITKLVLTKPDYTNRIIVSCEAGFRREADVIHQLYNIDPHIELNLNSNPDYHAKRIIEKYSILNNSRYTSK